MELRWVWFGAEHRFQCSREVCPVVALKGGSPSATGEWFTEIPLPANAIETLSEHLGWS